MYEDFFGVPLESASIQLWVSAGVIVCGVLYGLYYFHHYQYLIRHLNPIARRYFYGGWAHVVVALSFKLFSLHFDDPLFRQSGDVFLTFMLAMGLPKLSAGFNAIKQKYDELYVYPEKFGHPTAGRTGTHGPDGTAHRVPLDADGQSAPHADAHSGQHTDADHVKESVQKPSPREPSSF